ncbi:hypothetical protein BDZ45DRAFT_748506 [Acephala macrosclerotiorum]|nr:hypothetical protein BDZ45DRAFT_748506 [Acephala macrosclerotiorum]
MAQEDRKLFWGRENDVSEQLIQFVDENILAKLPRRHSGHWQLSPRGQPPDKNGRDRDTTSWRISTILFHQGGNFRKSCRMLYGFPVPTFMGKMPQYTTWTDSWEEFFTNAMRKLMSVIEGQEDPDPEFRQLFETVLEKVVPRLLRPLETGGRHIRPRLVHGDLYSGNVSVETATGAPILERSSVGNTSYSR